MFFTDHEAARAVPSGKDFLLCFATLAKARKAGRPSSVSAEAENAQVTASSSAGNTKWPSA
jgi:hypothetical protein